MTVVVIVGTKHSPGVSTLAGSLAYAHGGRSVIVEADPAGGDYAIRSGRPTEPGLVGLAAAARNGLDPEILDRHLQTVTGNVSVLAAPPSAVQTSSALDAISGPLARLLARDATRLAIIDGGRLEHPARLHPFLEVADLVLVLARPTAEDVAGLRARLRDLDGHARRVVVGLVGDGPYGCDEVAANLEADRVERIAWDPATARAVAAGTGSGRWLARRPLIRSATHLLATTTLASVSTVEAGRT